MKKYFCDMCGAEMPKGFPYLISVSKPRNYESGVMYCRKKGTNDLPSTYGGGDRWVCRGCMEKVFEVIYPDGEVTKGYGE